MEKDILDRLAKNEERLDQIFRSVEKTRKYFLWTLIISVIMIVLPLIGLVFAIPQFLKTLPSLSGF